MDLIGFLVLSFVRDVLVQGAGAIVVLVFSLGRVTPDFWSSPRQEEGSSSSGLCTYVEDGQSHMYAVWVFLVGIVVWLIAIFAFFAFR